MAYRRFSWSEREEFSRGLAQCQSLRDVARALGRAPSTLSREWRRPGSPPGGYRAWLAATEAYAAAHRPRCPKKLDRAPRLRAYVLAHLRHGWSPRQIAIRLRVEYPDDVTMRCSHETIYRYLYVLPRGTLKRELLKSLRTRRRYRQRRGATYTRRQLVEPLLIDHRPAEVAARTIPGHWEGDLLLGAARSPRAIGTLVERTSRFTVLVPIRQRHDPTAVSRAFARRMQGIPTPLRKTLTTDQGAEFRAHRAFTAQTAVQVYFCHPHSPWERGTCENTNGLLRQYFPKGFTRVSPPQVARAQDLLNNRPRQGLGGKTPREVFYGLPVTRVALDL